jgi:leucyl aminopeptidase
MVSLQAQRGTIRDVRADIIAQMVFEDKEIFRRQIKVIRHLFTGSCPALDGTAFTGKEHETLFLYPQRTVSKRVLLIGVGKSEKLSLEKLRRAVATAVKVASRNKAKALAVIEPDPGIVQTSATEFGDHPWENIGMAMGEGAALALYRFNKYVTGENKRDSTLTKVLILCGNSRSTNAVRNGLKLAGVLCEATYAARDLQNAPPNEIFPDSLARAAVKAGRRNGFAVRVFDERKIKKLKMGGLLGVARGSENPPRFIVMEHRPRRRASGTVVLVGKGVTFDAGGISIKPAAGMAEMKMDMSGAAAVIGTMQAAARLRLPVRIIGLVPATENLLGGAAMKPGDILTHFNGKTSEIDNTDAEGRLILADALSYASQYKADLVIDLATLTGACVVALGHHASGMMGNAQKAMDLLKVSGERTYERVWQLPLFEEYEKLIRSDVADVKNTGGRWAGAITAALFLKKFIGDYKWVHLDIAGTAIMDESLDYIPKGGSGVGVRLLTDFLRHWKKGAV